MKPQHLYAFGPYCLDADELVLRRDGQPVTLPPKDLETLLVLVQRAGHIVDKEELLEEVWPGVHIEEGNLARHVFNLRQALGDGPDGRKYIETIPKRGYRFVAAVQEETEPSESGQPNPKRSEATQPSAQTNQTRSPWSWAVALSVILAVTVMVSLRRYLVPHREPPQRAMLAVLPFENLSGDPSEDYFADGLTEEMIAQLGQLQPAKLGVIARTSTKRYKHTKETIAQIGQELGAGYLLEGSVRRGGERVRITAQLIQATQQTHLWAETYERPLTDVLTIQREIAEKITHSLSIQLLPAEMRTAATATAVNLESYDNYLLGLHALGEGTRDSENRAVQYFQEAIAANPNDARLYAALAQAYDSMTTYYSSPKEVMPQAEEATLRALQLDPNLASAHATLGFVHWAYDWDWAQAQTEYRRALELNPSLPDAQLGYATYLATLGQFDEAISRVQQAYQVDPLAVGSRNDALWIYYFSGRMPETIEQSQRAIELAPAAALPHAMLALANAELGQHSETLQASQDAIQLAKSPSVLAVVASALARIGERAQAQDLLAKALAQAKERYVCRFIVAEAYMGLGENEKALDSLEQGLAQRST